MNIAEMHVWFRQYAQQMGMQNVRAILPEQIDLLINTSITDIVNQLIRENIGITNDRVISDNSKIGQINALKNLYKVKEISMEEIWEGDETACTFMLNKQDANIGKITNKGTKYPIETGFMLFPVKSKFGIPDYLYIVDFSLNYKPANVGYGKEERINTSYKEDGLVTNYFPVRIIDDAYLADTLNDFVLRPRLRSPIMVIYNTDVFDIYIEPFKLDATSKSYKFLNDLVPYKLRFSYIAEPAKVKYVEDLNGTNIDCDLPEYMHVDILKHAVDLYRIAVSGSLHASQQQEQAQQQENVRNNYRNEGTNTRQ